MSNLLEKSFDMGIGLFAYSRDKIEDLVNDLVKKGEVARKDAQGFTKDLVKKGEEQRNEIKKFIRDEINDVMDTGELVKKAELREILREELQRIITDEGIARKKDVDALKKQLDNK